MKSIGEPKLSLEEYIDYVHGIVPKRDAIKDWKPMATSSLNRYHEESKRHRELYPSVDVITSGACGSGKREPMKYTGTLIKGIATMHKSNAVPVINSEQMKDIARMRR
jgi:hypothetical protein